MICLAHASAAVDKQEDALQAASPAQIGEGQASPGLNGRTWSRREDVSGKIHKMKSPLSEIEEVELLCPAWRIGGPRQLTSIDEGVDQAGFSNIRSAGESNLRPISRRKMVCAHHAFHEDRRGCEEPSAVFDLIVAERSVRIRRRHGGYEAPALRFRRRFSSLSNSVSTPFRRMMTYCCTMVMAFDQTQ